MSLPKYNHHERSKVAIDRPKYREGNRDRAVKVFTINKESAYILIKGVPDIKISRELLELCSLYGAIDEYRILDDYPTEAFTKVYWIKYQQLQAARVAKRKLDDHSFYGGVLHVCYAPEYETVSDTRLKLQERRKAVARRLRQIQHDVRSNVGNEDEEQTNSLSMHRPPNPTHDEKEDGNLNRKRTASKFEREECGFPALPDPPRQLPFEKWKHQKTDLDDPRPRVASAHSTLPCHFNPYPDGYRPPGPPQCQLQRPRQPEQLNSFDDHKPSVPHSTVTHNVNPHHERYTQTYPPHKQGPRPLGPPHKQGPRHMKPWQNEQYQATHPQPSTPRQQTDNFKKDLRFVPSSVTRKRSSAEANLSNTPSEHGKRLNSELVAPSKAGITFYRQGKSEVYGQATGSKQTTEESCSFSKTIENVRRKMVSNAPSTGRRPAAPPHPPSSSTERIRI